MDLPKAMRRVDVLDERLNEHSPLQTVARLIDNPIRFDGSRTIKQSRYERR
jgi:hypothetical protein